MLNEIKAQRPPLAPTTAPSFSFGIFCLYKHFRAYIRRFKEIPSVIRVHGTTTTTFPMADMLQGLAQARDPLESDTKVMLRPKQHARKKAAACSEPHPPRAKKTSTMGRPAQIDWYT
eukprot:694079-Pleurochrysis_carterae.AAC.1